MHALFQLGNPPPPWRTPPSPVKLWLHLSTFRNLHLCEGDQDDLLPPPRTGPSVQTRWDSAVVSRTCHLQPVPPHYEPFSRSLKQDCTDHSSVLFDVIVGIPSSVEGLNKTSSPWLQLELFSFPAVRHKSSVFLVPDTLTARATHCDDLSWEWNSSCHPLAFFSGHWSQKLVEVCGQTKRGPAAAASSSHRREEDAAREVKHSNVCLGHNSSSIK